MRRAEQQLLCDTLPNLAVMQASEGPHLEQAAVNLHYIASPHLCSATAMHCANLLIAQPDCLIQDNG